MAESYFGTHLCKLTTVSGTVGGQLRQVSLYYDSKQMEVQPTHEILCLLDIPRTTDIVRHDCMLITVIFYLCHVLPNSSFSSILQSTAKLCISEIIDKYSECEITTVAP